MLGQDDALAVLGCGTMGQAIVAGLRRSNTVRDEQVTATVRLQKKASALAAELGIAVGVDNLAAAAGAGIVVVALKPQRMRALLDNDAMREAIGTSLVISVAAGVRMAQLEAWLPAAPIIRAMPNTPCLIGKGMTVFAPGAKITEAHLAVARAVFDPLGECIQLEDKHMDAVTSLNGSGPAFAYVVLESLADGGVMMGLPRDVALQISAQVLLGSASMVQETGFHPAALKDQVTTPAGSTIAGLLTMEDGRIRSVLARAIQEATKVASNLGRDD